MPPEPAPPAGEIILPGYGPPPHGGRVLVVDDDPAVRESLKFSLTLDGFEVECFPTAESLASEAAIEDGACLIIDYRLPGMNGLQLLALLRSRRIRAQAIVITSHPSRNLREEIALAGAILIEKPLLCDGLTAAVRSQAG